MSASVCTGLEELLSMPAIQAETYRELFSRYMDVARATEIVRGIKSGDIQMVLAPPSMIGASGIFSHRDQIPPPTADQAVISNDQTPSCLTGGHPCLHELQKMEDQNSG